MSSITKERALREETDLNKKIKGWEIINQIRRGAKNDLEKEGMQDKQETSRARDAEQQNDCSDIYIIGL